MFLRFSLLFILLPTMSFRAQTQSSKPRKDRFPSYFGLVASPVFANDFTRSKTAVFKDPKGAMTTTFNQGIGLTFGASVRIGITKLISIETGIFQVRRNYKVDISIPDSNLFVSRRIGFANFDIPLNALVYIQLSKKWYMNVALGLSVNQYTSDIRDSILPGGNTYLDLRGIRISRAHFSTNAGVGFEYRNEKAGTFYLGMGGKMPFKPVMHSINVMYQLGTNAKLVTSGNLNGGYFSIDFRYYLPTLKLKKKAQFIKGPIEQ